MNDSGLIVAAGVPPAIWSFKRSQEERRGGFYTRPCETDEFCKRLS
jgi:hypothetical protein